MILPLFSSQLLFTAFPLFSNSAPIHCLPVCRSALPSFLPFTVSLWRRYRRHHLCVHQPRSGLHPWLPVRDVRPHGHTQQQHGVPGVQQGLPLVLQLPSPSLVAGCPVSVILQLSHKDVSLFSECRAQKHRLIWFLACFKGCCFFSFPFLILWPVIRLSGECCPVTLP